MKRAFPLMMAALLLLSLVVPYAAASSVEGTGQSRVVTLNHPTEFVNTSVAVPAIIDYDSNASFAFTVMDESSSAITYTFNVSIYNNGTWFNESVDITSIADDNVTGYVNFTAGTFPVRGDSDNITITQQLTSDYSELDAWYGTVGIVDGQSYMLRVTMTGLVIGFLAVIIVIIMLKKILAMMNDGFDGNGKDKK